MTTTSQTLQESLEQTRTSLGSVQKRLASIDKSFKDLARPGGLDDLGKVSKSIGALAKLEPELIGQLVRALDQFGEQLDQHRKEQEKTRPMLFGRQLREAAEQAGLPFAPVTASPPCYRLGVFTVEPNFKKGVVELCYARLPLGQCGLEVEEVLSTYGKLLRALEAGTPAPEELLSRLYTAYRKTLAAQGRRLGERVEVVDILAELALLSQSKKFLANPVKENFKPYGKVRLAWELAALKRAGQLEIQGRRLSLGTATIGTTKQKDRVLYLEGPGGKGQYYLSLAFTEGR